MPKRKSATRRAFVRGGILGLILAALVGCAPPDAPEPPKLATVKVVRIDNTPEQIAWCNSNPGGVPKWAWELDGTGQVIRYLTCYIVS